jgi:hypothetical protein
LAVRSHNLEAAKQGREAMTSHPLYPGRGSTAC